MGLSRDPGPETAPVCPKVGKMQMTKSEAKSYAKRSEHRSGLPMQAFKCGSCGHWHTGKKRGWSGR